MFVTLRFGAFVRSIRILPCSECSVFDAGVDCYPVSSFSSVGLRQSSLCSQFVLRDVACFSFPFNVPYCLCSIPRLVFLSATRSFHLRPTSDVAGGSDSMLIAMELALLFRFVFPFRFLECRAYCPVYRPVLCVPPTRRPPTADVVDRSDCLPGTGSPAGGVQDINLLNCTELGLTTAVSSWGSVVVGRYRWYIKTQVAPSVSSACCSMHRWSCVQGSHVSNHNYLVAGATVRWLWLVLDEVRCKACSPRVR